MTITQGGRIYRHRANVELIDIMARFIVQRRVSMNVQWPSHQNGNTPQRLTRLLMGTGENMIDQNMGTLGFELHNKEHCPISRNAMITQGLLLSEIFKTRANIDKDVSLYWLYSCRSIGH